LEETVQLTRVKGPVFTVAAWFILLTVPPLALAWTIPAAWSSVTEPAPTIVRTTRTAPLETAVLTAKPADEDAVTLLDTWTDTVHKTAPVHKKVTDLSPLAKHIADERAALARLIARDRSSTMRFIRVHDLTPPQSTHILADLTRYEKRVRDLLLAHIRVERASGSPFNLHYPTFRP
jgi:hypothetical protein